MQSPNITIPHNKELNSTSLNKETLEAILEAECISKDPYSKKYSSVNELFEDLNVDE